MSLLLAAITQHAQHQPAACALTDGEVRINYGQLPGIIAGIAGEFESCGTIGIALDNSPLWALADLATVAGGKICVPLPGFFSAAQINHAITDAGIELILTDRPEAFLSILSENEVVRRIPRTKFGVNYSEIHLTARKKTGIFPGTAKVTYTSGTTGSPKGVCLPLATMEKVAESLYRATAANFADRYVSVLPLSTLLENLAGVYVPLFAGACCTLLPLEKVGLYGAAKVDVAKMAGALIEHRASSTILTPQLLQAILSIAEAKKLQFPDLRFVAVGGAPVAKRLLARAQQLGIPVFEGYGLSECASVVSLNVPGASRPGSAGKPLPHVALKFSDDGEILLKGAVMSGYSGGGKLGETEYWPSGDKGFIDSDGFLHLTGRKKNIFITSFGRNVSPEWVESELTLHPAIAQAAVFGEGRPWNVAVLVPRDPAKIEEALLAANAELPDYARIRRWIAADSPFLPENGQLTPNGRLKRDAIWPLYRQRIEELYDKENHDVL